MFDIPEKVLEYWQEQDAYRQKRGWRPRTFMGPDDFAEIERIWGYRLPESYKLFMTRFGSVQFPDFFCAFDYAYQLPGGPAQHYPATINSVVDLETLRSTHKYSIVSPDNATGGPFYPPFMLGFAGDPDQSQILLELGSDTPRIWFREAREDAFGEGNNTMLGFVANDIVQFINNLRPWE